MLMVFTSRNKREKNKSGKIYRLKRKDMSTSKFSASTFDGFNTSFICSSRYLVPFLMMFAEIL
jgi:hypothetical protein